MSQFNKFGKGIDYNYWANYKELREAVTQVLTETLKHIKSKTWSITTSYVAHQLNLRSLPVNNVMIFFTIQDIKEVEANGTKWRLLRVESKKGKMRKSTRVTYTRASQAELNEISLAMAKWGVE